MKKNIKFSFILTSCLLIFILITNSCSKENELIKEEKLDDNPVSSEYTYQNINFKNTSLSKIKNNKNFQELINSFKLENNFIGNDSEYIKNSTTNYYGFTIDTTNIKEIVRDNYYSCTFNIHRNENKIGYIENLLVEIKDGLEKAYIISYTPDKNWLISKLNHIDTPFYGKVKIEEIKNNNSNSSTKLSNNTRITDCNTLVIFIETSCPCAGHWPGQYCTCYQQPYRESYTFTVCSGGGDGYTTEGYIGSGSGGGSGSTSSTIGDNSLSSFIGADNTVVTTTDVLKTLLNLNTEQSIWLSHNTDFSDIIYDFVIKNGSSPEAMIFVKQAMVAMMNGNIIFSQWVNIINYYNIYNGENAIDLLTILNTNESEEVKLQNLIDFLEINTILINSTNQSEYETAIKNMTNYMRQFGYPDLVPFADYIDSLIPEFINFTMGDVEDIYQITRKQYNSLRAQYFIAVIKPVAEAMLPFIEYAIIDATFGVATPLLNKINISLVAKGSALERMVIAINKLGVPFSSTIRNINGSSILKAEKLFVNLTKNAVSISAPNAEGTIVANMGNNCYITYRTSSSTGAIATIDFNFPTIWGVGSESIRKLKFFP